MPETVTLTRGYVEFGGQEYPFFDPIVTPRRMRGPTADPAITQREEEGERLPLQMTESLLTGMEAGFPIAFLVTEKGIKQARADLSLLAHKQGMLYRGRLDGSKRTQELLAVLHRAYAPFADEAYTSPENRAAMQRIEEEYLHVSGRTALTKEAPVSDELSYLRDQQTKQAIMDKEIRLQRDAGQKVLYVIENFDELAPQEQYMLLQMAEPDPSGSLAHLTNKAPKPCLVILHSQGKPIPESLTGNRPLLWTYYQKEWVQETALISEPGTQEQRMSMEDPLLHRHPGMAALHDAFMVLEERIQSPLELSMLVKVRQLLLSHSAWTGGAEAEELLGLWEERLPYLALAPTIKRTKEQRKILEEQLRQAQIHVGHIPRLVKSIRNNFDKLGLSLENREDHGAIGKTYHRQLKDALDPSSLNKVIARYIPSMDPTSKLIAELRTLVHQGYSTVLAEALHGIDLTVDYSQKNGMDTIWKLSRIRSVLGMLDKVAHLRSHMGTAEAKDRVEMLRKKLRFTFQQHHGRLRPNYRLDESEQMLEEQRLQQLATLPDIVEYLALHFSVLAHSSVETNAEVRDALKNIFGELRDDLAPLETLCDLGLEKRPTHPRSGESLPPVYTKNNLHIGFANRAAPELRAHVKLLGKPETSEHDWDVWSLWIAPEFDQNDVFPRDMTEEERQTFKNNLSAHIDISTLYFASMTGDASFKTEIQRRSYLHTPEEIFSFVSESWNPVLKVINERRLRSDLGPLPHFPVSALLVQQIALAYEALLMLSYSGKTPYPSIAAHEAVRMFKQKHRNNDRMLGYVRGYVG